jgi:hypothetical protein
VQDVGCRVKGVYRVSEAHEPCPQSHSATKHPSLHDHCTLPHTGLQRGCLNDPDVNDPQALVEGLVTCCRSLASLAGNSAGM